MVLSFLVFMVNLVLSWCFFVFFFNAGKHGTHGLSWYFFVLTPKRFICVFWLMSQSSLSIYLVFLVAAFRSKLVRHDLFLKFDCNILIRMGCVLK